MVVCGLQRLPIVPMRPSIMSDGAMMSAPAAA
jgi:hypothetical protein